MSPESSALAGVFFTSESPGKPPQRQRLWTPFQQKQRPAPCFKVGQHLQSPPWLASAAADPWSTSSSWSVLPPPGCWPYRHFPVNPATKSLSHRLFPESLTKDTFLKLKSPSWNTEKTMLATEWNCRFCHAVFMERTIIITTCIIF